MRKIADLLSYYLDKPSPLKLSVDVERLELPAGTANAISCSTDHLAYPHGKSEWFKDDRSILTGSVITDHTLTVLHFSSLKKEDTGKYKCTIEYRTVFQEKRFQLLVIGKQFLGLVATILLLIFVKV